MKSGVVCPYAGWTRKVGKHWRGTPRLLGFLFSIENRLKLGESQAKIKGLLFP
jgi:hypothetical protein